MSARALETWKDYKMNRLTSIMVSTTLLASISLSSLASANLIDQAHHLAVLNEGNIKTQTYNLPPMPNSATEFEFNLKGYVFGLRMIKANYTGWFDQSQYTAYADIKTSGLGALLKKLEIWAVTTGHYSRSGLKPKFHIQQNLDKKNRRVEMNYDNTANAIDVAILPPLGSQGLPPASPAERYSADDTISAILNLMMQGQKIDGPVCSGTVKVFDSKQHYGLRMVQDGTKRLKFQGEKTKTIKCLVYYEPISGFDPEDLPNTEEGSTPINIYMKEFPEIGLYIPIRFTYKISSIKAVIKLDDMQVKLPNKGLRTQLTP